MDPHAWVAEWWGGRRPVVDLVTACRAPEAAHQPAHRYAQAYRNLRVQTSLLTFSIQCAQLVQGTRDDGPYSGFAFAHQRGDLRAVQFIDEAQAQDPLLERREPLEQGVQLSVFFQTQERLFWRLFLICKQVVLQQFY